MFKPANTANTVEQRPAASTQDNDSDSIQYRVLTVILNAQSMSFCIKFILIQNLDLKGPLFSSRFFIK